MSLIQKTDIDDEVEIVVWRKGEKQQLSAKISQVNAGINSEPVPQLSVDQAKNILNEIGIQPVNLGPSSVNGVGVQVVIPNSLADGKILPGDVIYQINQTPIYHVSHFYEIVLTSASTTKTEIYVIRNDKRHRSPIVLEQVNRQ